MVVSGGNPKMQGTPKPRGRGFCWVRPGVAEAKTPSARARRGLRLSNPAPGASRVVLLVTLSGRTRCNANLQEPPAQVAGLVSHFPGSAFLKSPGQQHKEGASAPSPYPPPHPHPRASRTPPLPPLAAFPSPLPRRGSLGAPGWRESALRRLAMQTHLVPISREEGARFFGEPPEQAGSETGGHGAGWPPAGHGG